MSLLKSGLEKHGQEIEKSATLTWRLTATQAKGFGFHLTLSEVSDETMSFITDKNIGPLYGLSVSCKVT